jgi:hypothetical protein
MHPRALREDFVKSLTILVYDRSLAKAVLRPGHVRAFDERLGKCGRGC